MVTRDRTVAGGEAGTLSSKGNISVLLLVTNTLISERWSGIHKVALELARNLPDWCELDLVKWDIQDGQLRFCDIRDLERAYGAGGWQGRVNLRRTAHKVRYRFGDMLNPAKVTWLINPEISYHSDDGNEILAKVISQCREYGVRFSSIFYDLIPISNPNYADYSTMHAGYTTEILRSDLILPISSYSGGELVSWWRRALNLIDLPEVEPILLPELETKAVAIKRANESDLDTIVMVGTVEPRKQQVEFLRAFLVASKRSAAVSRLKVFISGSLHPAVAHEFRELISKIPTAEYFDYAAASTIDAWYRSAAFSAFPSVDEGYGLPIAESLARGVPCLCANFGSMAEVAEGGGCLTIDVLSLNAMEDAIVALAENLTLRAELGAQLSHRQFRTWADYARECLEALSNHAGFDAAEASTGLVQAGTVESADKATFVRWAYSDSLIFEDADDRALFIAQASKRRHKALLPPRMLVKSDENTEATKLETLLKSRVRMQLTAKKEGAYARVKRHYASAIQTKPRFLRIVISTYNRANFVRENVRWLLANVAQEGSDVQVVVVDNASTDDSLRRLVEFVGHPNYHLIRSTANTGMLGNLKTCSTLTGAEYVWVIGDDDYIVPEETPAILAALRANQGIPFAFLNFGIYHRFAFNPGDGAANLIGEKIALAPDAAQSGIMSVRDAGSQHDNMYTAIYPIIWRSDVLAACFNYPFTGKPFVDLTESVPTTKIILETYPAAEAYWHQPISIVGNAHNSWSRHRPRWHAMLMPMVFELARDAGMSPELMFKWSRIHETLYSEAVEIAKRENWQVDLELADMEPAWRLFRKRLSVPSRKSAA